MIRSAEEWLMSRSFHRGAGQHQALVGDAGGQHHVEGGYPVGGHDEQKFVIHLVGIPDLAPVHQVGKGGLHQHYLYLL